VTAFAQSGLARRRHRRFVDGALQGRLIWPLVVFEIAVFAFAMVFVYIELEAVIDSQLYRVHRAIVPEQGLSPVLQAVLVALPWILVPNAILIVFIARQWHGRVKAVVEPLDDLFRAAEQLDLRQRTLRVDTHDVLMRATLWHDAQRARCAALRRTLEQLSGITQGADREPELAAVREHLEQIQRLAR